VDPVEASRMTLGEHLDELRGCLIRAILGLVAGCLAAIWPARYVLEWTIQPLQVALERHGQPVGLLATSPTEPFVWYVKVVVFLGLVVASPYIILQFWRFVAAGLYPREKKAVYRMVPASVALFLVGVAFMYVFVLILSLNFLIGFSAWFPLPGPQPTILQRWLLGEHAQAAASQPAAGDLPTVPTLWQDPPDPPPGSIWFNAYEHKLKFKGAEQTFSAPLQRDGQSAAVTTHFRIGEYLSFVLILALAFGVAFQVPLVVIFLARSGIVPLHVFKSYRKVVILLIVIIAGAIAPPDLLSHLLLSVPMILLFELGLLLARPPSRRKGQAGAESTPA
jgi:sec-independent protein translocase protein TatC